MQIIRRKLAMIADSPLDKFIQSMTLSKQLTKNPYGYKYLKSKTNSLDSHIPFPPYLGAERFWISSWWHTEIPLEVLHDWDRERQLFCSVLHHLFGQFVLYHELGHISYHFGGGCHLNVYCTVHQSMWDNKNWACLPTPMQNDSWNNVLKFSFQHNFYIFMSFPYPPHIM